jgi:serine/threonine-protein kinase
MTQTEQDAPLEGTVLAGKYRVEKILGRGGMGVVVAARHLQLGQRVALKFLLSAAVAVPEAVERFLREARAVVQIQGEHVARVTDVGTLDSGAPYMVMEYLDGADLAAVLRKRGSFSQSEAVDYVLQACEAIAEAHALGIVHRDLKPANLFLTQRADGSPLIKVLDFGIAKATQLGSAAAEAASMTSTSAVMGSPLYLSPEQIRSSRRVDARADIWALGVVLHELLTGSTIYDASSTSELLAMIVADPPRQLRSILPTAPAELEAIILRCLEKEPARRFASVVEFAAALQHFGTADARVSAARIARILGAPCEARTEAVVPVSASSDLTPDLAVSPFRGTQTEVALVEPKLAQSSNAQSWGATASKVSRPKRSGARWFVAIGFVAVVVASLVAAVTLKNRTPAAVAADTATVAATAPPAPSVPIQALPAISEPVTPPAALAPPAPPAPAVAAPSARPPHPQPAARAIKPAPTPPAPRKPRTVVDPFDDTH